MFRTCLISLSLIAFSPLLFSQSGNASLVNPFIGTGGHGHTFPGPVLPFGMVQLSPDTRVDGSWDGCSGYHYSDNTIYGFSHTHLSGTGCSDWGDFLVMPTAGEPSIEPAVYSSKFSHINEKASAGFYEVLLDDDTIKAELTVTPRVGIHRYTFPGKKEGNITIDLLHRDKVLNCYIFLVDSVTIIGYRSSEAWAKKQEIYFVMKFSKPYIKRTMYSNHKVIERFGKFKIRPEGGVFTFDVSDGKPLMAKLAISPVNTDGAKRNLAAEAEHWDFEKYKKEAQDAWNKQLQKFEVTDKSKDKLTVFYTALYHCFIHPSLSMDVDGQYRGRDDKIHRASGFTNYSVFSLWDTYRALHPLFTIIERNRSTDFINSFLHQYQQSGRLPVWELSANETDCMIGFHSVSVIADALAKGIKGFDADSAYLAMKAAANYSAFGIPLFNKNGYLSVDDESESVSRTLEYAYDNWCLAQVAKSLGKEEEAAVFLKRSLAYKHLFDPNSGFMRPRKNGNWLNPFYPSEINNHFTEGNSWQYSFYVPQDVEGLIKLHGGPENFEKKLDLLFSTNEKAMGREQADVTGLIGQYAHGNEPSHHMAYLYNFVGKPQKTIERVTQICNDFYKNTPDGLIGNEDCGQMSAWYVLSSLGMYPVCPGSPDYVLGTPNFNNIKINLETGKTLNISSEKKGRNVLSGLTINSVSHLSSMITQSVLLEGGSIKFLYSPKNESHYGIGENASVTKVVGVDVIPAPLVGAANQVFKDNLEVSIKPIDQNSYTIVYTKDGSEPVRNSIGYQNPIKIDSTCSIKAKLFSLNDSSSSTEAHYYKLKYKYEITISSEANSQYAAEGAQTLIDGIELSTNWRKGNWLGYQGQDFSCTIDLKEKKDISYMRLDCLQDTRSWILFPSRVNFYSSSDNKTFNQIDGVDTPVEPTDLKVQLGKFEKYFQKPVNTRYLKIIAQNYGKLPDWHEGKGGDAFIFVGELEVK
ncbi:MAG: GH92 family glycosyl hydrolase [bacterium]|nr:GH92 family glycosyl hydrolase [bacterium]